MARGPGGGKKDLAHRRDSGPLRGNSLRYVGENPDHGARFVPRTSGMNGFVTGMLQALGFIILPVTLLLKVSGFY